MSRGRKITEGREAEIYEWQPEGEHAEVPMVLKLFRADFHAQATRELAVSDAVKRAGVPAPMVFGDAVELDGRRGVVYERIIGADMLNVISSRPWKIGSQGRLLGKLHARIHQAKPTGLPLMKERLGRQVERAEVLTDEEKSRILDILAALPGGDRACHGDMHPGNVIVREDGEPVTVDWGNATLGDPMADVARSQLLMLVGWRDAPRQITRLFGRWASSWFLRAYKQSYFAETEGDPREVDRWGAVIAAARLSENIPQETEHVVKLVRSGLAQA